MLLDALQSFVIYLLVLLVLGRSWTLPGRPGKKWGFKTLETWTTNGHICKS